MSLKYYLWKLTSWLLGKFYKISLQEHKYTLEDMVTIGNNDYVYSIIDFAYKVDKHVDNQFKPIYMLQRGSTVAYAFEEQLVVIKNGMKGTLLE